MKQAKIFYSYAHEDESLRIELEKHLSNLKKQEIITTWNNRDVNAGSDWIRETSANINVADIILLLISPDFMNSEYCTSFEMTRALERHKNGTTKVIPILLRPVDYDGAPFSHLKVLPMNAVPIKDSRWSNIDEAFLDAVKDLRKVIMQVISDLISNDAMIFLYNGDNENALKAFSKSIIFDEANAVAHYGKGRALMNMNDHSLDQKHLDALHSFNASLQLEPNNILALIGKAEAGSFCFPQGKKQEAINIYQQALSIDPTNEQAYLGMAVLYHRFAKYDDALSCYEKALELSIYPNIDIYLGHANTLFKLKRYEDAIEVYESLTILFPNNERRFREIGDVFFEIKKYDEAIDNYDEVIKKGLYENKYDEEDLYYRMGEAFQQVEKYDYALEYFEHVVKMDPGDPRYLRSKGGILEIMAKELFTKAEEIEAE